MGLGRGFDLLGKNLSEQKYFETTEGTTNLIQPDAGFKFCIGPWTKSGDFDDGRENLWTKLAHF